ncbi:sulfite exporter TauE/SafE family protein [Oleidesulfovibrio alaskensis]|nr:sulfite exporter TauE/SafE family protein [Oleidesulfovibrio alaskensis]MBG0773846.1 sulfite exporter TauE/SafE family protein [Oleidesulfovibrio alaskensis]
MMDTTHSHLAFFHYSMLETGLSLSSLGLAFIIVFFGAFAQGVAGFGLALLIGPLLNIIDPVFLPGPVVLLVSIITALMAYSGRRHVSMPSVRGTIGGYLIGTVVAAALISSLPQRETALLLSALILAAVGMSASGLPVPQGKATLLSAGLVGGFMGTVSGVGLPPLALALQNEPGPRLRGTLAFVGLISIIMAQAALAYVGKIGQRELTVALMLAPAVALGYLASRRAAALCDAGYTRPVVFLVSALSAIILIIRNI